MRALLRRVPPPFLFAVPLVLGLWLDHHCLQPLAPRSLERAGSMAGVTLIAFGAILALSCIALFAWRRTTIVPHGRARSLVTTGPFRISRNPMYVALSFVYLGACFATNAAWLLFFLALPLVVLQMVTIPMEERTLREAFGREYETYTSRVRRWL